MNISRITEILGGDKMLLHSCKARCTGISQLASDFTNTYYMEEQVVFNFMTCYTGALLRTKLNI